MEWSREQEIQQIEMKAPHVVFLGAGASRAAFPNGDKYGKALPLMQDFSEIVPVGRILDQQQIDYRDRNFEDVYSELIKSYSEETCRELELCVYKYFDALELPPEPTIYDHLVMCLRPKDIIATFNWDPFLIQAIRRNPNQGGEPRLLFLHGNVLSAFCSKDKVHGLKGASCSQCGKPFKPSSLLYPTAEKNYELSPQIADAWQTLHYALEHAFMVTIYGYGAPASDVAAIAALKKAWGPKQNREMEQFEIIDIRDEDELVESWGDFIHTHHYEVHPDIYDSWIFRHPRRTGEAYLNQYLKALFIEDNPVPRYAELEEIWAWYENLFSVERNVA